jgi:hypothetical protein
MQGILFLASEIQSLTGADFAVSCLMAKYAIYRHELFHFVVECMVAELEGLYRKPIYVHRPKLDGPGCSYYLLEEAMAHANMARHGVRNPLSKGIKGRRTIFRKIIAADPPGYRDGFKYFEQQPFKKGLVEIAADYLRVSGVDSPLSHVALDRLFPLWPRLPWEWCPLRIIKDETRLGVPPIAVHFFRSVRIAAESPRFRHQLSELPSSIQSQWRRATDKLRLNPTQRGLDFKKWIAAPDGQLFSLRVNKSYRAHLLLHAIDHHWIADSIGTHKEMGHG